MFSKNCIRCFPFFIRISPCILSSSSFVNQILMVGANPLNKCCLKKGVTRGVPQTLAPHIRECHESDRVKNAIKLAEKVNKSFDKIFMKSKKTLNGAFKQVQENAAIVQNKAREQLEVELQKYQHKFDELKRKAEEKGVDIIPCIKHHEEFKRIPIVLVNELNTCILGIVNESEKVVQDTMSNIDQVKKRVFEIKDGVIKCSKEAQPLKCITETVKNITDDIHKTQSKIMKDVAKATILLTSLNMKIEKCLLEKTLQVEGRATAKLSDFGSCLGVNG